MLLLVGSLLPPLVIAQQEHSGVRITFLPPPLEGMISAGIYSLEGKLVRTLAREATEKDFAVGLNGLITQWDGKDDAGMQLPPGRFFVRGYAVGKIDVDGVAFHGNDWLVEDEKTPRIAEITAIQIHGPELLLIGSSVEKKNYVVHLARDSGDIKYEPYDRETLSTEGLALLSPAAKELALKSEAAAAGPPTSKGKEGTVWTVEASPGDSSTRRKVLQRSRDGSEILRELDLEPGDPLPVAIAASPESDEIHLLERDSTRIRVRGLKLRKVQDATDGKSVSEWELFVSKSIHHYPSFEEFLPHLDRPPPPQPVASLRIALVPNELLSVAPAAVQISIGIDEKGSFLKASDGLPLRRVTDTPHLRWATLATQPDGVVLLFQSDGAAVEEYRLGKLDQMMAFDAGEYTLPATK